MPRKGQSEPHRRRLVKRILPAIRQRKMPEVKPKVEESASNSFTVVGSGGHKIILVNF